MICTVRRPKPRTAYVPYMGNFLTDLLNTPIADVLNKDSLYKKRPDINMIESEEKFVMELAVPGHNKTDINITIDEDVMTIKSTLNTSDKENDYRLREFNYAGFERKFQLGEKVDQNKIDASFNNGILTISLSKKERYIPQPAKTISIK